MVMHDTTNIDLPAPSSWIFGLPLVTGHCNNNQQIKYTMILEMQKLFAEEDPTSLKAFLNIFDKGYLMHKLLEAKQEQGQLCCQPDKVNLLSNGEAVLHAACVAVT